MYSVQYTVYRRHSLLLAPLCLHCSHSIQLHCSLFCTALQNTLYCTAHYTILHCTLHCTALYTTLYCTAHYTVLHATVPHNRLHFMRYCSAQYTALYTTLLHCTLHCTAQHTTLSATALHNTLHCAVLHCNNLLVTTSNCIGVKATEIFCTAFHCNALWNICLNLKRWAGQIEKALCDRAVCSDGNTS